MNTIQNILVIIFLSSGTLLMLGGSIGILRLPDFFTRLHAASKIDTLGIILFITGMIILNGMNFNSLKLFILFLFTALTNPVGSHAFTRAAYRMGLRPLFGKKKRIPNNMQLNIQLIMYLFLIVSAALALQLKDLMAAVVSLSVFSFMCAVLYVSQGAVDVAFTEATVGAGVTSVLLVVLLYKTTRRSKD